MHQSSVPDIPGEATSGPVTRTNAQAIKNAQAQVQKVRQKSRPRSPKNAKSPSMAGPGYNILKAKKDLEVMRKKFNDELLAVLEQEQSKENQREMQIQQISNPQEAALMEQQFGIERAKASQKIIDISNEHEEIIMKEMRTLGLI